MQLPEEYVKQKHWTYRTRGKELEIETCPFCGDTGHHFHINSNSGLYNCLKCSEGGSLWKLKKELHDFTPPLEPAKKNIKTPQVDIDLLRENLAKSHSAIKFLNSRKLGNKKVLEHFRLGYDEKRDAIAIPYFEGGKLINVKYRSIASKQFQKEPGCASSLLNIDHIDKKMPVIITEGEFDCMAAFLMDFENVVSLPDGANSVKAVESLESTDCEIMIATDNDIDGNKAAERITGLFGSHRCKRLVLPVKDFNDALIEGMSPDDIQECIYGSQPVSNPELLTYPEAHKRLVESLVGKDEPCMKTGWDVFDGILGGLRYGELTVLSADTGIGKTTWGLNVGYRLCSQNIPILLVSSEMLPEKVLSKLYSIHTGQNFESMNNDVLKHTCPNKVFTKRDLDACYAFFSEKNLFMWDGYGELPLQKCIELIKYSVMVYGVKYVLLDHLHFFLNANKPEFERQAIEEFTKGIARTAIETNTHIILICHPTKLQGNEGKVRMNDLKGSASIKQDAHNVITLCRNREYGNTDTEVWLQKVRDDAGREGKVIFEFDPDCQQYSDTTR